MRQDRPDLTLPGFLDSVRAGIMERLDLLRAEGLLGDLPPSLLPGKMLRTRLAARLALAVSPRPSAALRAACIATEIVHTASLCHDDVIDNAAVRRSGPALWKAAGVAPAILIGDWLLCEAIRVVAESGDPRRLRLFLDAIRGTCSAEVRHEIALRGRRLNAASCIGLAGGKTGPLFAFPARAAAGRDAARTEAFARAAYGVGVAYQLADDLIDGVGRAESEGKTLGTDARRGKQTLPGTEPDGRARAEAEVVLQCRRAVDLLRPWPKAADALDAFIEQDLMPVARRAGVAREAAEGAVPPP